MMKQPGTLVALEGIDGAGKTTLASAVAEELSHRGLPVRAVLKQNAVAAPEYVHIHMSYLRRLLWKIADDAPIEQLGDLHWIYLQAAYFSALHETTIKPALSDGFLVVVDSWIYKFVARASLNEGRSLDEVLDLVKAVPVPDFVYLIKADPAMVLHRRKHFKRAEKHAFGKPADFVLFQGAVLNRLTILSDRYHWGSVDNKDGQLKLSTSVLVNKLMPLVPGYYKES